MKLNAVKFKDRASFDKNKVKPNVIEVHEPFGIIVFADEQPVPVDKKKVSHVNIVDASLDSISTGLVICIANDWKLAQDTLKKLNMPIVDKFETSRTIIAQLPDGQSFDDMYDLLMIYKPAFQSIEPDFIQKVETSADGYTYAQQWHLGNLKAAEAWSLLPEGYAADVAVLDIACDVDHEDLAGMISSASWNCVTNAADVRPVTEFEKHGTCCSGLICATADNGIGVTGLGGNRLKVQFLHIGYNSSSGGGFQTSDTIVTRAINKAIENPRCVAVSMSWGGTGTGYTNFINALNSARATARGGKGMPLFASSGNAYASSITTYPAVYDSVIAVGASTQSNTRAVFSNYGTKLFAATPGVSCPTVDRTGAAGYNAASYTNFSGTSAACPVMAAIAAAILVKNPELTEPQVREILKNSARKTGGYVYDANGKSAELGFGVVEMYAAVVQAGGTDPIDPPPPPAPVINFFGVISTPAQANQGASVIVTYSVNMDYAPLTDIKVPVTLRFQANGTLSTFYTGEVTVKAGTKITTMTTTHVLPNNISGMCMYSMSIDATNVVPESNELDNYAQTPINVVQVTPPTSIADMSVLINGFSFVDATRVRVTYTFKNVGAVTVTSLKAQVGFDGKSQTTWNRGETYLPNQERTMSSVFPSTMWGTLPNTFRIKITQVNGATDTNTANNEASILIS
jgi:subtilisin family serine protease